jgi:hypothetical protein
MRTIVAAASQPSSGVRGLFVDLLQPPAFHARVHAGVDAAALPYSAPRSMADVLNDPRCTALRDAVARVALPKAEGVLSSVRAKGAATGDVLDAKTEALLWPQIFAEAFAGALVAAVEAEARGARARVTADESLLANPFSVAAGTRRLVSATALAGLCADDVRWGCSAGPWASGGAEGEEDVGEWCALTHADVMAAVGRGCDGPLALPGAAAAPVLRQQHACLELSAGRGYMPLTFTITSNLRWVDPSAASEEAAPALHELVTRLNTLPHVLNRAAPRLRLLQALAGCTAARVAHVTVSAGRPTGSRDASRTLLSVGADGIVAIALGLEMPRAADAAAYKVCSLYVAGEASSARSTGGEAPGMYLVISHASNGAAPVCTLSASAGNALALYRCHGCALSLLVGVRAEALEAAAPAMSGIDCGSAAFVCTYFHGQGPEFA